MPIENFNTQIFCVKNVLTFEAGDTDLYCEGWELVGERLLLSNVLIKDNYSSAYLLDYAIVRLGKKDWNILAFTPGMYKGLPEWVQRGIRGTQAK